MFGNCKVCAEKDKRVLALESEIAFLRAFIRPAIPKQSIGNFAQDLEADAVLSGHTTQILINEKSQFVENYLPRLSKEEEEVAFERDAILNATY